MKSSNIGLRIVEVLVLSGLFFAAVSPLFSSEGEKENSTVGTLYTTSLLFDRGSYKIE